MKQGVLLRRRWLGGLLAAALCGAGAAHALQVTDDAGATVHITQPVRRIVSLLPVLTETVCELGQCARLVAVDRYSDFPQSVRSLPQVGGGLDPNIEAIVALKPDLVLVATSSRAAARLRALGLTVLALEPKSHAQVHRLVDKLALVLAVPDASRVWQSIEAEVNAAAQTLSPRAKGARVYFEVNRAPYAAGEASFIGETLKRLGVRNIVPASLGAFPKLNPEFVVRADPDLIMVGDRDYAGFEGRPGWSGMRALREQRVCLFNAQQTDVLVRAGPRLGEGARIMAQCLQGKAP